MSIPDIPNPAPHVGIPEVTSGGLPSQLPETTNVVDLATVRARHNPDLEANSEALAEQWLKEVEAEIDAERGSIISGLDEETHKRLDRAADLEVKELWDPASLSVAERKELDSLRTSRPSSPTVTEERDTKTDDNQVQALEPKPHDEGDESRSSWPGLSNALEDVRLNRSLESALGWPQGLATQFDADYPRGDENASDELTYAPNEPTLDPERRGVHPSREVTYIDRGTLTGGRSPHARNEVVRPQPIGERVGPSRMTKVVAIGAAALAALGGLMPRIGHREPEAPIAAPTPVAAAPSSDYVEPAEARAPVAVDAPASEASAPVQNEAVSIVEPGEGLFQTYKELGIPESEWTNLSRRVGPRLLELGVVYQNQNLAGGYGFMRPGVLPPAALHAIEGAAGLDSDDDQNSALTDLK